MRRGLDNMKLQSYLTASAFNLKRLAAAHFAILRVLRSGCDTAYDPLCVHHVHTLCRSPGHRQHRTTGGYTNLSDRHLVEAAEKVGGIIAKATNRPDL